MIPEKWKIKISSKRAESYLRIRYGKVHPWVLLEGDRQILLLSEEFYPFGDPKYVTNADNNVPLKEFTDITMDQFAEIERNEALFAEAKKRYPIGTTFRVAHSTNQTRKVKSHDRHNRMFVGDHINLLTEYDKEDSDNVNSASVYYAGKWAIEIVEKKMEDEILVEAKKRFPVGTKFKPAHLQYDGGNYTIQEGDTFSYVGNCKHQIVVVDTNGQYRITDESYTALVHDNKWAEIVSTPAFDHVKLKEQIEGSYIECVEPGWYIQCKSSIKPNPLVKGRIYKVAQRSKESTYTKGIVIEVGEGYVEMGCDSTQTLFKPSTKEAFDAQFIKDGYKWFEKDPIRNPVFKLEEGKYYYIEWNNSWSYLLKWSGDKTQLKNISFPVDLKKSPIFQATGGSFGGNENCWKSVREATPQEITWLDACLKANKLVSPLDFDKNWIPTSNHIQAEAPLKEGDWIFTLPKSGGWGMFYDDERKVAKISGFLNDKVILDPKSIKDVKTVGVIYVRIQDIRRATSDEIVQKSITEGFKVNSYVEGNGKAMYPLTPNECFTKPRINADVISIKVKQIVPVRISLKNDEVKIKVNQPKTIKI